MHSSKLSPFTYQSQSEEFWIIILKFTDDWQSGSNQADRRLSVMSTSSFPSAPLAVTCICRLSHYRTKCRYKDRGGLDSIKHLNIMKTRHIQHVSSRTPGTEGRGGTTQTPSSYLFSVPCLLFFSFFLFSCWHSCKSVRLDSHSDEPHLYVGVRLSKW